MVAPVLGVLMAFVLMVLAITQVSNVEDDLVANTSGALATFADNLTFFWLLIVGLFAVGLVIGFVAWIGRN